MISSKDKTIVAIFHKPTKTDIYQKDIERVLIKCGFKKRTKQGGSHVRYKLEGVPNALIVLSGHGKNPLTPFYQVEQVREMLERLELVYEEY